MSTNGIMMMNASSSFEASVITSRSGSAGTEQAETSFQTMFMQSVTKIMSADPLSDKVTAIAKTEYDSPGKTSDGKDGTDKLSVTAKLTGGKETGGTQKLTEQKDAPEVTEKSDTAVKAEEPEEILSEETIEKIATLLNNVAEQICKVLDISPEQLEEYMVSNDLQPAELLNEDVLRSLTLFFNNGAEQGELLTDENLQNQFTQLIETVSEVVEDFSQNTELEAPLKDILSKPELKEAVIVKEDGSKEFLFEAAPIKEEADTAETVLQTGEAEDADALKKPEALKETNLKTGEKQKAEGDKPEDTVKLQTEKADEGHKESRSSKDSDNGAANSQSLFSQFADKLVNAAEQSAELNGDPSAVYRMTEIVNQLTSQIKINLTPDHTTLEMMLNPESLGKISLGITSKDGVMTAQFKVENEIAKEAIESQIMTLKENIEAQGIRVEAIEVTVTGYSFSQSRDTQSERDEAGKSSQKKHGDIMAAAEEDSEEREFSHVRYDLGENSTVNFVA